MPRVIAQLDRDKHNRPIPWFVDTSTGVPDFRVIRRRGVEQAFDQRLCWVCGTPMMVRFKAFVVGPMCAVNRTSAEPPSHRDCAIYSAQACPFLANPDMIRRERGLPETHQDPGGVMLLRNPGVALVWITTAFTRFRAPNNGGWLFTMGPPTSVRWYARGRAATRAEVEASMESGIPLLVEAAEKDGPDAVAALAELALAARELLPA